MIAGRSSYSEGGLTLVEVLVGVSISGLVLTILAGVYMAFLHLNQRATTSVDLRQISIVMDAVTTELRQTTRHDGVVIWEAETGGVRHDTIGSFTKRIVTESDLATANSPVQPTAGGWRYFVHDLTRSEVRVIDQPGERGEGPPPPNIGRILARNVERFQVTRQGHLIEVTIVAAKNGQRAQLQTAIWPRNQ